MGVGGRVSCCEGFGNCFRSKRVACLKVFASVRDLFSIKLGRYAGLFQLIFCLPTDRDGLILRPRCEVRLGALIEEIKLSGIS